MPSLYAIFHLNLAFSSIDEKQHEEVIQHCYWPLLRLVEESEIPLALELTAYTLECIANADPLWISKFKQLLELGRCELLASGDSQIIGPLVPAAVNRKNLLLGLKQYRELLNYQPSIAYINEQAVSNGLLDIYIDCGFKAVVVEWDNARALNPEWPEQWLFSPVQAKAASGRAIAVLWNWSIAFQKLQRVAHGQLFNDDYLAFVDDTIAHHVDVKCFPIYGNDAEVFDFRPGRFGEEAALKKRSEWSLISHTFKALAERYRWVLPSQLLADNQTALPLLELVNSAHPVAVKKQRKYNLSRWAITGRNDLWLNTLCFAEYKRLLAQDSSDEKSWQHLCRLWASDYRTHLTETRYQALLADVAAMEAEVITEAVGEKKSVISENQYAEHGCYLDEKRNFLHVNYQGLTAVINLSRGGSLVSLSFSEAEQPVLGTLEHGHFSRIELGADFYSNHLVVELPTQRQRVTDLQPVQFCLYQQANSLWLEMNLTTALGPLVKCYQVTATALHCHYHFSGWQRPVGSLRLGWLTLLDTSPEQTTVVCHHGGEYAETMVLAEDVDYGQGASTLVSANNCLGATEGVLWFGWPGRGVKVSWPQESCAAIPMLYNKKIGQERMTRLFFSLVEIDESLQAGGKLLDFSFSLEAWRGEP
ncbi:hypothetical protein [Dasania marina]|uniref:hypothetical protein n=1 Tax=Dasania marina TaxID=471499 RepID=UPI000364C274|nr:hypothetical protein [Dasania marina]